MTTRSSKHQTTPATTPDAATSTDQPASTDQPTNGVDHSAAAPAPAASTPKAKTPEQQATAKRREAGELRRSAKAIGVETPGGVDLLARATTLESEADALAPRKSAKGESRPICVGTKKDGSSCTAHAMEGSIYCTDHRPVRARFTDAEWSAFQTIPTGVIVDRLGWGVALKMAKEQLALNANAAEAQAADANNQPEQQ